MKKNLKKVTLTALGLAPAVLRPSPCIAGGHRLEFEVVSLNSSIGSSLTEWLRSLICTNSSTLTFAEGLMANSNDWTTSQLAVDYPDFPRHQERNDDFHINKLAWASEIA